MIPLIVYTSNQLVETKDGYDGKPLHVYYKWSTSYKILDFPNKVRVYPDQLAGLV